MRLLLVAAGALLTLAGCAAAPTATTPLAAPPAATTSTAPPTTTPPPLSKPDAAQRYLAIVKPYNVALERLETAINSGQPVATLRTRAAEVATANQEQINQLQTTRWPIEIAGPMAELIAESGKSQQLIRQAAQAATRAQLVQFVVDGMKHDGKAPAKVIRNFLELAKYDERDYGGT